MVGRAPQKSVARRLLDGVWLDKSEVTLNSYDKFNYHKMIIEIVLSFNDLDNKRLKINKKTEWWYSYRFANKFNISAPKLHCSDTEMHIRFFALNISGYCKVIYEHIIAYIYTASTIVIQKLGLVFQSLVENAFVQFRTNEHEILWSMLFQNLIYKFVLSNILSEV